MKAQQSNTGKRIQCNEWMRDKSHEMDSKKFRDTSYRERLWEDLLLAVFVSP